MPKRNGLPLYEFQQRFATEEQCRDFLERKRWPNGFVCPKCGGHRHYRLSNGAIQCGACRHQTSVTAGTVMHRSHLPLKKWFLAMYFMSQDKRGISAVRLSQVIGVTYKAAWYLLTRLRKAMGQRDDTHTLSGTIEFDDAFFGGPTKGKKRGRGTEKAKVFVALSLTEAGRPKYLKMKPTDNIKQTSVKKFAQTNIEKGSVILSDGYRSYGPALIDYDHQPKTYDPDNGMLRWLHMMIGNAKAFILGTYHGLPQKYLGDYLNEFCFRFSRRSFGSDLFDRLALAVSISCLADSKG
mgnify:CR=1 FL=1